MSYDKTHTHLMVRWGVNVVIHPYFLPIQLNISQVVSHCSEIPTLYNYKQFMNKSQAHFNSLVKLNMHIWRFLGVGEYGHRKFNIQIFPSCKNRRTQLEMVSFIFMQWLNKSHVTLILNTLFAIFSTNYLIILVWKFYLTPYINYYCLQN